jgi:hypothetical protein
VYISYLNSTAKPSLHRSAKANPYSIYVLRKSALRLMFSVLVLLIVFTFGALAHAYAGNNAGNNDPNTFLPVSNQAKLVVERGDTLWTIASDHAVKGQDVRGYIEQIKTLNGMTSDSLRAGQLLLLP